MVLGVTSTPSNCTSPSAVRREQHGGARRGFFRALCAMHAWAVGGCQPLSCTAALTEMPVAPGHHAGTEAALPQPRTNRPSRARPFKSKKGGHRAGRAGAPGPSVMPRLSAQLEWPCRRLKGPSARLLGNMGIMPAAREREGTPNKSSNCTAGPPSGLASCCGERRRCGVQRCKGARQGGAPSLLGSNEQGGVLPFFAAHRHTRGQADGWTSRWAGGRAGRTCKCMPNEGQKL